MATIANQNPLGDNMYPQVPAKAGGENYNSGTDDNITDQSAASPQINIVGVDCVARRLNAAKSALTDTLSPSSFISVETMKDFVAEGQKMQKPKELVNHAIVEHETTILFGDTGLGKTTLAIQWAIAIAEQRKRVLFVNFELTQQQMGSKFDGKVIPNNLYIANIRYELMHDVTDQSQILGEIERLALQYKCEVIIIDNLTNLCINSKEGSEAGNIMLKLISLRMVHNWTMLILAHVPKRKPTDPLTINDLAGSKIISNFADNVIGINKSKKGNAKRYLIQLKYRSLPIELDYKNVQELTMTNSDGYIHFDFGDYDEERKHLPRSRDEKEELEREIIEELRKPNGLSYRDIAEKCSTSLGTVQRVAKASGLCRGSNSDSKMK